MSDDARLARLYRDPRAHQLDAEVRTRCSHAGVVDEPKVQAAQAAARSEHRALWLENPDMTAGEDRELRAARGYRGLSPNEVVVRAEQIIDGLRTPVYRTKAAVQKLVAAEKAANAKTPVLNRMLNEGAGNSPALARLRLTARSEQMNAARPKAGRLGRS